MNTPNKEHKHNIGKISTALTLLCSIHCVATPFLAIFIPVLGGHHHGMDWLELAMIAGVVVLGGSSLLHGYKDHHGNSLPAKIFAAGITLLIVGFAIHGLELHILHKSLMISGSLISAFAQIYNLKLNHQVSQS